MAIFPSVVFLSYHPFVAIVLFVIILFLHMFSLLLLLFSFTQNGGPALVQGHPDLSWPLWPITVSGIWCRLRKCSWK